MSRWTARLLCAGMIAAAVACAAPYRGEGPRAEATERTGADAGTEADAGAEVDGRDEPDVAREANAPGEETIVGVVSPDGAFRADTLATPPPDPAVERSTVVSGTIRRPGSGAEGESEAPAAADDPDGGPLVEGYRVQVFAARDRYEADRVARRIMQELGGEVPAYVDLADGWFKVRLGNATDRDGADRLRARVAELGYDAAFVVRTAVRAAR